MEAAGGTEAAERQDAGAGPGSLRRRPPYLEHCKAPTEENDNEKKVVLPAMKTQPRGSPVRRVQTAAFGSKVR